MIPRAQVEQWRQMAEAAPAVESMAGSSAFGEFYIVARDAVPRLCAAVEEARRLIRELTSGHMEMDFQRCDLGGDIMIPKPCICEACAWLAEPPEGPECVCYVHPVTGKPSTRARPSGCPVHSGPGGRGGTP